MNRHSKWPYTVRVLIGIDQLINAICGGDPDETVSSRLGRAKRDGRLNAWTKPLPTLIYNALEEIDPGHCERSIEQ